MLYITRERYKKLRRSGMSHDQIKAMLSPKEDITKGREAKEFLERGVGGQIFSKRFAKQLPRAIIDTVVGTPTRFARSAIETPERILRGGKTPTTTRKVTSKIPYMKSKKTYQETAEERFERVMSNEAPLWKGAISFVEVPLAGLETFFLMKGVASAADKGMRLAKAVKQGKTKDAIIEMIKPVNYKKGKIDALKKGRVTKKGAKGKIVVEPDKRTMQIYDDVKDVMRPKKGAIENIRILNRKIEDIAENTVRPFLRKHPEIGSLDELEDSLRGLKDNRPPIVRTNRTLETTYDSVIDMSMDHIRSSAPKGGHTAESLWDARKGLDRLWQRQFGDNVYDPDKVRAVKLAIWDARDEINSFIVSGAPNSKPFTQSMRKMSNMYKATENIAEHSWRLVESTRWSRFLAKHPSIKKIAPWLGWAILGGGALGYGARRVLD